MFKFWFFTNPENKLNLKEAADKLRKGQLTREQLICPVESTTSTPKGKKRQSVRESLPAKKKTKQQHVAQINAAKLRASQILSAKVDTDTESEDEPDKDEILVLTKLVKDQSAVIEQLRQQALTSK